MKKVYLLLLVSFSCGISINLKAQLKIKLDSITDERKSFLAYEALPQFKNFEITRCGTKKCNGTIIQTFENSSIKSKIDYYKGLPNGKYELFYSNGNHKVKGLVHQGFKNGSWKYYYENGKLNFHAVFSEKLNNHPIKWIEYFPNGSINYYIELDSTFQLIREFELNPKGDTIFQIHPINDKSYPYYCKRRIGTTIHSKLKQLNRNKSDKNKKQGFFYYKILSSLEGINSFFKGSREKPSFKERNKNSK